MKRFWMTLCVAGLIAFPGLMADVSAEETPQALNQMLNAENREQGITAKPTDLVDDLAYLRRVSIDLIGRIPSHAEIQEYQNWPAARRREMAVDKLMADSRFVDRWTTFYSDMLRLRANAPGGAAAMALVHKSVQENLPYDELVRRFLTANGKAGAVPEVAFVLGDDADPMALAGVTAQVFMGIRISCAQCHDHPFDKWKREDFYGFAAYFGKTRRYENDFTNTVFTREVTETSIMWPPEGVGPASERKPVVPRFLVDLVKAGQRSEPIAKLEALRKAEKEAADAALAAKKKDSSLDDLLADAGDKAAARAKGKGKSEFDVVGEAQQERRRIDLKADLYSASQLRSELAELITSPRNGYFSRNFVNRVWNELIGRGFVNPVDDFSDANQPTHPKTLDFVADEFVGSGFQLRPLVRMIVLSEPYQRRQAVGLTAVEQQELEEAFLATPPRRMIGEVLYDSIVVAGHLFDYKHPQGANQKTVTERIREIVRVDGEKGSVNPQALGGSGRGMAMNGGGQMAGRGGYSVEGGIELNFDAVLAKAAEEARDDAVTVEKMEVKSPEQLEAERMMMERGGARGRVRYVYKEVERTFDDNPLFGSSFRMASPVDPEHFIRVFGQTDRTQLGIPRDHSPSMRQALMMLNGKLTHEASRVGPLEPLHKLLVGEKADLDEAVKLAYLEILTRVPDSEELAVAKSIVEEGESDLDGMADLRWVLLNSNEFRYLP